MTGIIHTQQESEELADQTDIFFCNRMKMFNMEAGWHINLATATFGDLPGVAWCLEVTASLMYHQTGE